MMRTTSAAITRSMGSDWEIGNIEVDSPRGDEVLVRIVATGLCHTDMSVRDQYLPMPLPAVLGHEGAGIVEEIGPDVTDLAVGDHVVLTVLSCGKCGNCLTGRSCYCDALMPLNFGGTRADGTATLHEHGNPLHGCFFGQSSFAGYAIATQRNAIKIPDDVPLELMGPLGCGIQTGAGTVINALKPEFGSVIAIFGTGPVGLAAVMAAKLVGCGTIIAVDLNDDRLQLARELGATHTFNGKAGSTVESIRALGGARYSVDTTGVPSVIRQAVECLTMNGHCRIVGVSPPGTEIQLEINSILFGQTIGGVIEGETVPKIFIPALVEMWRQGRFPFDRMVRFYDIGEINLAVEDSLSGRALKPVLKFPAP
jgi:aryl-alcohol dehydrogenase